MSLQTIRDALQALAEKGELRFSSVAQQVPAVGPVLTRLPPIDFTALEGAGFDLSGTGPDEKLSIRARATWGELASAGVLIDIASDPTAQGKYVPSLTLRAPESAHLSIPGIDWFELGEFTIGARGLPWAQARSELSPGVVVDVGTTLLIDGDSSRTPIPIRIESDPTGEVRVALDASSVVLPSINDVLAAFGSDTGGINLPSTLDDLAHFSLLDLRVAFQPSDGTVTQIGIEIGNSARSTDGWPIIPGVLSLESYRIGLNVADPLGTRRVGGLISATARLGTVDIGVAALHPASGGWDFQGYIGKEDPVPIGDLVSGLGQQFGVTLPAALHEFTLQDFEFGFDTRSYDASGRFTVAFTVNDTAVELNVTASLKRQGDGYAPTVAGTLAVGTATFAVSFDDQAAQKKFRAEWRDADNPLEFADIAAAFGFTDLPQIPASLELALTEASLTYDFTDGVLLLTAQSKNYGSAVFVADRLDGRTSFYGFGIDIPLDVTLADLPLVGDRIPDGDELGLADAGVWILSGPLAKRDVESINALIDGSKFPLLPDRDVDSRVLLHARLELGSGQSKSIDIPLGGGTAVAAATGGGGGSAGDPAGNGTGAGDGTGTGANDGTGAGMPAAPPAGGGMRWFDVQKQFGVFQFKRIGAGYGDDTLRFALDAGITLGPLGFSMDGLSIRSPLTRFEPTFDLRGLGLAYAQPPLLIEGALLKQPSDVLAPDTKFQFDGVAVVKASTFSLSAIGSYAQLESGDPSLFVFAQLESPLGGPPAFFVTGLMAGFGFNRYLAIPAQDEVQGFPLLVLAQPPAPGQNAPAQDPMKVLDILEGRAPIKPGGELRRWIAPSPGDYWLAVGLEFTSFEVVNSKALLIAEFGHDLTFALLGLSTIQLPLPAESAETYAYAELQLEALFKPEDGVFGLSAVLSDNSYVLTPDCRLTGGFAFWLWFGENEHAGQFVVTLGGYHPAFKRPAFFPAEPRLGFNWPVSSTVTIKGGAYFALTPSCAMAGGALEALFHDGDLKAWFTANADLLVSWRPFFFTAQIGVSVGVSYRLDLLVCHKTVSVSIGATVDLWGPPTGGRVHVHLAVVSFTVRFGSDGAAANDRPLAWTDFASLLPHPDATCRITASDGMYKTAESPTSSSGKAWVVRARKFRFFTQSAVQASRVRYGDDAPAPTPAVAVTAAGEAGAAASLAADDGDGTMNVRPMNRTGVVSTHRLRIFRGGDTTRPVDVSDWTLEPRRSSVPESLWGAPPSPFTQVPSRPAANVLADRLVGYDVSAPPPAIGDTLGIVPLKALAEEYLAPAGRAPIAAGVEPSPDFVPGFRPDSVAEIETIMSPAVAADRQAVYQALEAAGLYSGANGALAILARDAAHLYSDPPMVQP